LQGIGIFFSEAVALTIGYFNAENQICQIDESLYMLWTNTIDGNHNPNYCTSLFIKVWKFDSSAGGIVTLTAVEFGIALTVILLYLLTQDPHDCFDCLGKDPNASKYSIYQFERIESMHTGV